MNDDILRAIESLCDDIATDTNADKNQKRADAILTLAVGGKYVPEKAEEEYTEDEPAEGNVKAKIPKPGEQFEYGGIKFTVLGEEQGGILAIVSKLLEDDMPFDTGEKNDWRSSSLRKYLNEEYIKQFDCVDILPFESDLTSDNGMEEYGTSRDYIFLLSCGLYRKYKEFVPRFNNWWWWTLTPWEPFFPALDAHVVSTRGGVSEGNVRYGCGVAPACLFNPKVFE